MTEVRCISRGVIRIVVGTVLLALVVTDASSQSVGNSGSFSDMSPLDLLRERMTQSASSPGGVPQEGAVDPDEYRVGPGDVFQIGIGGPSTIAVPLTVTADGHLMLPDAGAIFVSGRTLAEARGMILDKLKPSYRNVLITATLAQPRQFYVHVVGAVPSPGRYVVMPVGRVLDAVSLAFADTTRFATSNLEYRSSFRRITVTSVTGDVRSADLIRYLVTGDTSYNPYLRDGDVVQVSAYRPATESVFINGDVPFAGTFEYLPGDTVADLLTLATGQTDASEHYQTVRVTRRNRDGSVEVVRRVGDGAPGALGSMALAALDQVFVRRYEDVSRGVVDATGAINFPGAYPIDEGSTSLLDLVNAAGGFRDDALRRGAYVERRAGPSMTEVPMRYVGFSMGPNLPSLFLPDTSAIVQRIRLAPMDWRGTNYLLRELRTERRMALDLETASEEDMARITMLDGDRLVVPRDDGAIFVFGQVQRAGFVPFAADKNVAYYVQQVGGSAELAADVFLVEAGTGAYRKGDDGVVRPGDMIFVDSREYLADTLELSRLAVEEKRIASDQKFRTTQLILQTVGSVASLIALVISATR